MQADPSASGYGETDGQVPEEQQKAPVGVPPGPLC